MGGEEAAVYCWYDGEECDFWSGGGKGRRRRRGGFDISCAVGGAVVGGEIRHSEAVPYGICIEGKHKLDGRAGEEGRDNRIDGSMDVVQW